jgi:hypothetical protein
MVRKQTTKYLILNMSCSTHFNINDMETAIKPKEMNLIVKPEQSGKTFVMIQEINKFHAVPKQGPDMKTVINFIFCDNNLLLTKQTSKRIDRDIIQHVIAGEKYVELSSRKGNETRSATAAYGAICDGTQNIICCTNGKRVDDISKIVTRVNASPMLEGKCTFKVWLDEADKFDKHIAKTFFPLSQECDNVEIWLMTATPKKLFKKFNLNIFPMEKTTQPDYHGWKDNRIVKLDDTFGSTGNFISRVLSSNHQLIQPGTNWYIPAEKTKNSHHDVAMRCIYHQMAVFIVNGDGLTLERPGMDSITEEKTEELNPHIMRMYADHGLDKYAVAITGYLCVSRGISIMSKEFIFDYGILSSCKNKAEASQSAGRLKGNIKGWANYKPPMVFTTEKFDAVATEWEEVSRRLAEDAFDLHEAGESTVIPKSENSNIDHEVHDHQCIRHSTLFNNMTEVVEFLGTTPIMTAMGVISGPKPRSMTKKVRDNCNGYAVSTRLLRKGNKAMDLTADDRLTIDKANEISDSTNISANKGQPYFVIPVYESLTTPADEEKYQVRYLQKS